VSRSNACCNSVCVVSEKLSGRAQVRVNWFDVTSSTTQDVTDSPPQPARQQPAHQRAHQPTQIGMVELFRVIVIVR